MCFTKYTDFRCVKCDHLLSWRTDHGCYEHPREPGRGCRISIERTDRPRSNKKCRKCSENKKKEAAREGATNTWAYEARDVSISCQVYQLKMNTWACGGLVMYWRSMLQNQIRVHGWLLRDSPTAQTSMKEALYLVYPPIIQSCQNQNHWPQNNVYKVTINSFCTEFPEVLYYTKKRECSAYSDQPEKVGSELCPNTWSYVVS